MKHIHIMKWLKLNCILKYFNYDWVMNNIIYFIWYSNFPRVTQSKITIQNKGLCHSFLLTFVKLLLISLIYINCIKLRNERNNVSLTSSIKSTKNYDRINKSTSARKIALYFRERCPIGLWTQNLVTCNSFKERGHPHE